MNVMPRRWWAFENFTAFIVLSARLDNREGER